MRAISEHKITNMVLVPTMINMLIHHPDFESYDLSSLEDLHLRRIADA